MPQHRAGLRLVAVAAGVDDHLAGDPGGRARAVPDGDQVQREVDAAGDAGRGHHPVIQRCTARPALTLALGYRRASSSCRSWCVVHRRPSSRPARPSASAPEHTLATVPPRAWCAASAAQAGRRRARAVARRRSPPAGDDDQVAAAERGPGRRWPAAPGPARSARRPARRRSAAIAEPERRRRWRTPGPDRPGPAGAVRARAGRRSGHDPVSSAARDRAAGQLGHGARWPRTGRPARTRCGRARPRRTASAGRRGSARSAVRPGGASTVRDRGGRGGVDDEGDPVAEVGGEPGGRLAALLGADAADSQLADAAAGQDLLQVGGGESVVRGLGEHRLTAARGQAVHQPDVARRPGRRRRPVPGSLCSTQTTRSPRARAASASRPPGGRCRDWSWLPTAAAAGTTPGRR